MSRRDEQWARAQPLDRYSPQPAATNPGHRPAPLPILHLDTLEGQGVPDRRWLVTDWIPQGSVTMLSGDGGMGKSLLAQMLATCVATGNSWLGLQTQRCRALGIFCEDDREELHRRQHAINEARGLSFADLGDFNVLSGVGQDNALHVQSRDEQTGAWRWDGSAFFQQIHDEASNEGYQFVIFDSLHDLFAGNENSRVEVRRFIQQLHGLALDIEGTVLLTAHPSRAGKTDGSGESGSTAWNNSVRSRLYLEGVKTEEGQSKADAADQRKLSRKKSNYAKRDADITLRWRDGAFVVDGAEDVTAPLAWIDERGKERACEETFLVLLDKMAAEGRRVSYKQKATMYAPRAFAKRADRQGFTRDDFERAMERLFEAGTVQVGGAKDNSRRWIECIERATE